MVVQTESIGILLAKDAASGLLEEPDLITDPMLDSVAPQLKKGFHWYVTPSEIEQLQDKAEHLCNAQCLKLIKINDELYYAITSERIKHDRLVFCVGQLTAKGCQPLVQLWSELVAMDVKVKDVKNTEEDTIAELLDGVTVNIFQLHDRLPLALIIIGNANVQVALLHHDNFKQYIHYNCQEQLHHTNLLGGNIFQR